MDDFRYLLIYSLFYHDQDTVDLPLNSRLLLHFSIFIFFVLWYDQLSMICSRHIKHSDPDDVSFVSLFLLPAIRRIIYTQFYSYSYFSLTFLFCLKKYFLISRINACLPMCHQRKIWNRCAPVLAKHFAHENTFYLILVRNRGWPHLNGKWNTRR